MKSSVDFSSKHKVGWGSTAISTFVNIFLQTSCECGITRDQFIASSNLQLADLR